MVIYFPRTFGSSYNMINVVKKYFNSKNITLTLIVSHPDSNSLTLKSADIAFVEPSYNPDENDTFYLDIVQKNNVDLIIPGESSLVYFKLNEKRYIQNGCKLLISGSLELLNIFRSKTLTYRFFEDNNINISIPLYKLVNNLGDFIEICEKIQANGSLPCFKPDISQGASGFRIVDNSINNDSLIYGFPSNKASLNYYINLFRSSNKFPNLIVSEYLNGDEVTLDAISYNKECLFYYPRIKNLNNRLVIDKPYFSPLLNDFILKSGINYLWNLQIKYHNDKPYLLEVNPRYSGGSYLAEENGYPMLCTAIEIIMFNKLPDFKPLQSINYKMIESYIII